MGASNKYWRDGLAQSGLNDTGSNKYWLDGQASGQLTPSFEGLAEQTAGAAQAATGALIFSGVVTQTASADQDGAGTTAAVIAPVVTEIADSLGGGDWIPLQALQPKPKKKRKITFSGRAQGKARAATQNATGRVVNHISGTMASMTPSQDQQASLNLDTSLPEQWRREDEEALAILEMIGELENA